MAFVFDSTVSGTASNSYISVAEADDYFTGHLEGNLWLTLSTQKKQAALVQATYRLDAETYGGRRTIENQALQWPRTYIIDRDKEKNQHDVVEFIGGAYYRPSNVIPKEIKQATCEQALFYIKLVNDEFTVSEFDLETLSNFQIGPINASIQEGYKADRLPTKVKRLLKSIGPNAWEGERAIRISR